MIIRISGTFDYYGRNTHSSLKKHVTLTEVEVLRSKEHLTSILPSQSNDSVVQHVEREALSKVSLKIPLKEVASPLDEIPGMVKLDSRQFGEVMHLILGAESVVDGGCHEDGSRANNTSDELVVLASDGIQDGRVESGHGWVRQQRRRRGGFIQILAGWVNVYPVHCRTL